MKNRLIIQNTFLFCLVLSGCEKLVEVDGPSTSVSSENVYKNDATAAGAMTYLYATLTDYLFSPRQFSSLSCIAGLSADELDYYNAAGSVTLSAYYRNALTEAGATGVDYWTTNFPNIYSVNLAIDGLSASATLTPAIKQQLLGEARFMRAFYYFYLVNIYGDVPLILTTDYTVNALVTKSPKAKVYQQIITDLKEAQVLLSDQYLKGDAASVYPAGMEERLRPTKWAAGALLARVYLYLNDWVNAEEQATLVLANTQFQLLPLDQVFLKNSKESIWQLQAVSSGVNTPDADAFVLPPEGPSWQNPVYLSGNLIQNFKTDDKRKEKWVDSVIASGTTYYYPYKYKVKFSADDNLQITEYCVVMRLAEQYLIRAEARARKDNSAGAIEDVDEIRKRAGLPLIKDINPAIEKDDLISVILDEKRIEFFTEWGHRWFDLKRTEEVDNVMKKVTPQKANGGIWESYQQYYPISLGELKANPNLEQINGY